MNKLFLKLISVFYPMLQKTGVDTVQLNEILRIKLLLDSRRPTTFFNQRKQASKKMGKVAESWGINFFLMLMGLFIGFILMAFDQPFLGQTIYFTVFMVMLSLTMISDFTAVLLDTRDQYIILPRPVDDRTVAMSRIMHIGLYIFRLAIFLGLPGIVLIGFKDGLLAAPLLLLQIIEATFLTVFLVNMVYLVLMRLVTPEQFKSVISYFQIFFSVVIFGSYYLLPRMINLADLKNVQVISHSWAYVLPSVWISALNEVLIHPGRSDIITSLLAIAGITVPLAGLWLVAKVLAPGFNRRLAIAATSDSQPYRPEVTGKPVKADFRDKIANFLASEPGENAGFKITWKMAARMREFKIKVYPAFAYVPIYFLYFALNSKGSNLNDRFAALQTGRNYILLIYLCTFIVSVFLQNISYSEKFRASWVYYARPLKQPGRVLAGMYKAIIALYFFPFCLLVSIGIVVIWGPQTINDIILAFFISLIYGLLTSLFVLKGLPFSKPVLLKQSGGRVITSLLITSFIAAAGFAHYFLMRWETVIWILIIPAIGIFWLMMNQYARQSWEGMEMEEDI